MTRARTALAAVLVAACAAGARAQLYPPARPGLVPKGVAAVDDAGRRLDLLDALRGPGPVVLLPIFTRCGTICPVLAGNLKSALARAPEAGLRVVLFSFDPSDAEADLRSFRRDLELPGEWTLTRAADAGGARDFLDQFGYSFMQRGRSFVHPSALFVLSGQGRWGATIGGGAFTSEDLAAAARRAEDFDSPSPSARLRRLLARPEAWAILAAAALGLAVAGALGLSLWSSRRRGIGA